MKITLTQAQMLSLWRRAQGLEPTAAAVSLEQWDSIDTEAQLALRMRQWYLRLLDTGDETLVATSDISTQISLRRVGDGLYAATLPATCRRLLRLNVTDECGTSMVVPDADAETAVTRYCRRRANPWGAPAFVPVRACVRGYSLVVACGHGPGGADTLPAVSEAQAVIDPGDETYILDEAALATIPGDVDLSTFV